MPRNNDILIFMPVGTSIVSNQPGYNLKNIRAMPEKAQIKLVNNLVRNGYEPTSVKNEFAKRAKGQPDKSPAELSSLWAFWQKKQASLKGKSVDVVLIHSPAIGRACAQGVQQLIENSAYFPREDTQWRVELYALNDLDPHRADTFPRAMDDLADMLHDRISSFAGEIYINLSGGYKALGPYLTQMATALGERVNVFYLYEESTEIIFLPVYPMSFNLLEWRDQRGLLTPFQISGVLSDDQKHVYRRALAGSKMQSLVRAEPPYELNAIGRIMQKHYEQGSGQSVSEFGLGFLLLDRFENRQLADYLKTHCIPFWRHLAVGDHIPETVEHGRGHVQRLLEIAQQLLTVLGSDLTLSDEQLFVLVCAIWLHDLGHTGDFFTFEGDGADALVQNKNNPASQSRHFVYGQPDQVRRYHNFLTYELLKSEQDVLFPQIMAQLAGHDVKRLLRGIQLACLFHRKAMPLQGVKTAAKEVWRVTKGIKDFDAREVFDGFALVACLLRVLDGAENQKERAVSRSYYKVMEWVLKRQVKALAALPEDKQSDQVINEKGFKEIQVGHFEKHRWVKHVFLVRENASDLKQTGIYGRSDGFLLGICSVANPASKDYNETDVVRKIINPFLEEFLLVQSVLPFRIALFLLTDDGPGEASRRQVVVTPDKSKKAEAWSYQLV